MLSCCDLHCYFEAHGPKLNHIHILLKVLLSSKFITKSISWPLNGRSNNQAGLWGFVTCSLVARQLHSPKPMERERYLRPTQDHTLLGDPRGSHTWCEFWQNITLFRSRLNAVPDPDLEIRGGGGGGLSRPLEKGGLQKNFFRSFGPQFGLKIRGCGPPGPLPWIHHRNDRRFVRYYSQAHKRTNKEIKTKRLERWQCL